MNEEPLLVGVDIGATGIKAGFFRTDGTIAAKAQRPNGARPQPGGESGWWIWDADEMWSKVCSCLKECMGEIERGRPAAVAVTGFGTDGLPIGRNGKALYPIISWHCSRTVPQRDRLLQQIAAEELFDITGYHPYPINAIHRWMWLREYTPEALDQAYRWLQVQDFIAYRLSRECATDATIASTTMALDIRNRTWSERLLELSGMPPDRLCPIRESGTVIGNVTKECSESTGLPVGIPVVTGGHDCELGVLGAGVSDPYTFIDITGTWEIIAAVVNECNPTPGMYRAGLDYECHALPGQWILQGLMIAGGIIEWLGRQLYRDITDAETLYQAMISDAAKVMPGSEGVSLFPCWVGGMGPYFAYGSLGAVTGLCTTTDRSHIARAAWEALCFQLRRQLDAIEKETGVSARKFRVIGGGQKNSFWNRMKADVTGRTVEVARFEEATILGAAIAAGIGAGIYHSVTEALEAIPFPVEEVDPDPRLRNVYDDLYESRTEHLPEGLAIAAK
jgi:L-fuculokinase